MSNRASAHTVADFFLMQVDRNAGDTISNLKLQKLCYYAQAWHCALNDGEPLFSERIEAWAHGPVVPDVYRRFRGYRWETIDPEDVRDNPYHALSGDVLDLLQEVWEKYGALSAKQLERLTHSEAPWARAYGNRPLGQACDEPITPDAMTSYYQEKLEVAG